jgi:hypothetical protein
MYRPGAEYLFMLKLLTSDELAVYWETLAPINEQVRGADDQWVQWVRRTPGVESPRTPPGAGS